MKSTVVAAGVCGKEAAIVVRGDGVYERDARELAAMIEASQADVVYVDCRGVLYFSSTAIGVLLSRFKKITKSGSRKIVIFVGNKDLMTLFSFVGVTTMYAVQDSSAEEIPEHVLQLFAGVSRG